MKTKKSKKQLQAEQAKQHQQYIADMQLFNKPVRKLKVQPKKETTMQEILASERNPGKVFKSVPITPAVLDTPAKIHYEGELAEREKIAQEEINKKKMRIAPAYSKGAYQYITDETDLTTMGRKI